MAIQVNPSLQNQTRAKDQIAKRVIYINLFFFISYVVYTGIIGISNDLDMEMKVILVTVPCNFSIAIRNPVITRFAFRVNQTIQRNTVEDRRQAEINEALRKREERQRLNGMRNSSRNENHNIPTVIRGVQTFEDLMAKVEV